MVRLEDIQGCIQRGVLGGENVSICQGLLARISSVGICFPLSSDIGYISCTYLSTLTCPCLKEKPCFICIQSNFHFRRRGSFPLLDLSRCRFAHRVQAQACHDLADHVSRKAKDGRGLKIIWLWCREVCRGHAIGDSLHSRQVIRHASHNMWFPGLFTCNAFVLTMNATLDGHPEHRDMYPTPENYCLPLASMIPTSSFRVDYNVVCECKK